MWVPRLKRAFDVTVATTALVAAAPVMAACAVAVRATMGSPVFFRQPRVGLEGQLFDIVKFRTMSRVKDKEAQFRDAGSRLTPVGKLLRAASLDELPQLWNVLRGDMSLVGPRPLLPQYLRRYTREQARRHEVMPGITGWAQVRGRNALTWEEKFALDVWYVDHQSFVLDMRIVLLTALRVLRPQGIGPADEPIMPEFMGSPVPFARTAGQPPASFAVN